jgi:hypothetical protein
MESEHEPDIGGGAGGAARSQRKHGQALAVRPAGSAADPGGNHTPGGNLDRPRAIHWSIDGREWHRVARPADLAGAIDYLISVGAMVRL